LINKFFIFLFFTINLLVNLHADEKQLIVDRLIYIDNITFSFEHLTNDKKEVGTCILVFDNKLICDYENSMKKRILINNKTLVVQKKKYNKNYFYPISNSPFIKIFNKEKLINLIKISDYKLKNNIELIVIDKNKEKIIIFFDKNSHDLIGWRIVDQLQNVINFSIKIKYINSEINSEIFKVPTIN
jgi:outer membrane lipoprotein-sorting protein|tara:strand:+ start:165 stop:722 length:558 start_codon:yes stop_codon:yes gene_type:complete